MSGAGREAAWRFRSYEPADLDALFHLDEACFAAPFRFSRGMMRRFAEAKHARVLVAETGIELAGFCIVHVERVAGGCVGYVVTLDVAEEFRRKGLARELMRRGEAEAVQAGCSEMLLHVFVGNMDAIRFYEKVGYARLRRAVAFYGHDPRGKTVDGWLYRKRLVRESGAVAAL